MRSRLTLVLLALAGGGASALAQTDHDNLDAGRPLRFEDAEAVQYRSLNLEYGLGLNLIRNRSAGFDGRVGFISGIALNTQLEVGFIPVGGGRVGDRSRSVTIGDYDVAYLRSIARERKNTPALAVRLEANSPNTGIEETSFRIRGIASRTVGAYDRLHLNVDVDAQPRGPGVNRVRVGAILGLSRPIGYPRSFDTTALAEIALVPGVLRGQGYGMSLGVGLRRQISPRAVLDLGLQSDVLPGKNAVSTPLRLVAGYSVGF